MAKKLYLENPDIESRFDVVRPTLPGAIQPGLDQLRGQAMAAFSHKGIPGPKMEEWKYTNLNFLPDFLANENFDIAGRADQKAEAKALFDKAHIKNIAGPVVVFVNGYGDANLSSYTQEKGVDVTAFSENLAALQASLAPSEGATSLNNLNRALVTDGYQIDIAAGVEACQPIQIIHIATSDTDRASLRTRAVVKAVAGAKVTIIETFVGADATRYWSHSISDIDVADGADVTLYQFQLQGMQAIHMTELHSRVADKAEFRHVSLQLGAEINRTEIINSFTGENAQIELRGAYLGQGNGDKAIQSHDIFTRINHDRPHCQSNQVFRGVLDAGGKSAFQGKVVVARDAQKTNADQSNKNLLLSRKAEANAKPELLIYADDVKCTHGATVGELDSDQLFYLRSRGLDERAAKGLLVEAFVAEVFDNIPDDILRNRFKELAAGWLDKKVTS